MNGKNANAQSNGRGESNPKLLTGYSSHIVPSRMPVRDHTPRLIASLDYYKAYFPGCMEAGFEVVVGRFGSEIGPNLNRT